MKIFKVYRSIEDDSKDEIWVKMNREEFIKLDIVLCNAMIGLTSTPQKENAMELSQKLNAANENRKIRWSID